MGSLTIDQLITTDGSISVVSQDQLELVNARSSDTLTIQSQSGDVLIGIISANDLTIQTNQGSILDLTNDSLLDIQANELNLQASANITDLELEEILANVPKIDEEVLSLICLSWQWGKKKIKAKSPERKRYCARQEGYYLEAAKMHIGEDFDNVATQILKELDEIVQSSSMVECINS